MAMHLACSSPQIYIAADTIWWNLYKFYQQFPYQIFMDHEYISVTAFRNLPIWLSSYPLHSVWDRNENCCWVSWFISNAYICVFIGIDDGTTFALKYKM